MAFFDDAFLDTLPDEPTAALADRERRLLVIVVEEFKL
jgi:hypothetical protein